MKRSGKFIKLLYYMFVSLLLQNNIVHAVSSHEDFLTKYNRNQVVVIEKLTVMQNNKKINLFDHVDNEEKYIHSDQRPILQETDGIGPFSKETDFTLLVSKSTGITIDFDVIFLTKNGKVPVSKVLYWLKPGQQEEEKIYRSGDGFKLNLNQITFYEKITLEIRDGIERDYINLNLRDFRRPVTIRKE